MSSIPGQDESAPRRTLPWQLPFMAVVLLCTLLATLFQPQAPGAAEPASAAAVVDDAPPIEEIAALTPEGNGDPLEDAAVEPSLLEEEDSITILVLGTDGRDEQDGPPRTDLMMLAVVDRPAGRVTLVSIPRDLWVPIPGYGEGKINTAFFLGALNGDGTGLARETVEALVGRRIDHTVQIDFDGFRNVIDGMGGIQVDVPEAIDDPNYPDGNYGVFHLEIPAGQQVMDGETALRYARTRHGGTDIDRSGRQQAVLAAMRQRAMEPAQLAKAPIYLRAVYREIETDLSLGDLFALARIARGMGAEDLAMHSLGGDLTESVITWNGQDALLYDPVTLSQTLARWFAGQ